MECLAALVDTVLAHPFPVAAVFFPDLAFYSETGQVHKKIPRCLGKKKSTATGKTQRCARTVSTSSPRYPEVSKSAQLFLRVWDDLNAAEKCWSKFSSLSAMSSGLTQRTSARVWEVVVEFRIQISSNRADHSNFRVAPLHPVIQLIQNGILPEKRKVHEFISHQTLLSRIWCGR